MAHASILCARMLPHARDAINRGYELFTMRSIGALGVARNCEPDTTPLPAQVRSC